MEHEVRPTVLATVLVLPATLYLLIKLLSDHHQGPAEEVNKPAATRNRTRLPGRCADACGDRCVVVFALNGASYMLLLGAFCFYNFYN